MQLQLQSTTFTFRNIIGDNKPFKLEFNIKIPYINYGLKPILQLKTPTLTVYIFVGVLHIEEKRSTELADIFSNPRPQGLGLSK